MSKNLREVSSLVMRFQGITALDDVSFSLEQGAITSLIGPDGAGKTTLFNLCNRHVHADLGTSQFDGHDITAAKAHIIPRHGIARTFQNLALFGGLSVLENLMVGAYLQGSSGLLQGAFRTPQARGRTKSSRSICL
jgi:ABC-type branched-subunit amino acid transport system ATPase component